MSIASLYPTIEPELNLDFSNAGRLDPRITFSRNSIGTYTDAQGIIRTAAVNEPRFDHDPVTGECLGLLVEEQRQNLLLRSEEFDQNPWTSTVTGTGSAPFVTPNYALAPNGLMVADRLQADRGAGNTSGDQSTLIQPVSGLSNPHTISISVWMKSNTGATQEVYFRNETGSGGSLAIVTTEWQRYTITSTNIALTADRIQIGTRGTINTTNSIDILVWGAQLEVGAFPTSYIPTGAAAVTRGADVVSMTGSRFSSWYSQNQGTVYCEATDYPYASSTSRAYYQIFNTSLPNTNFIRQWIWSGGPTVLSNSVYSSDSGPVSADFSTGLLAGPKKSAVGIKRDDYARSVSGGSVSIDASGTLPVELNEMSIGQSLSGLLTLNGHIKRLTYWPARLSNTTLQALTR
jgi:hypothetical protein